MIYRKALETFLLMNLHVVFQANDKELFLFCKFVVAFDFEISSIFDRDVLNIHISGSPTGSRDAALSFPRSAWAFIAPISTPCALSPWNVPHGKEPTEDSFSDRDRRRITTRNALGN